METKQQIAERIINQEVLVCVSSLVTTFAEGQKYSDLHQNMLELSEKAIALREPVPDYEEALIQAGFATNKDGVWHHEELEGLWEDAQEACDECRIDPIGREVYEFWAVSDWLARRLEEQGAKVDTDFAGLNVWARTETGQSLTYDAAIIRIAENLTQHGVPMSSIPREDF